MCVFGTSSYWCCLLRLLFITCFAQNPADLEYDEMAAWLGEVSLFMFLPFVVLVYIFCKQL